MGASSKDTLVGMELHRHRLFLRRQLELLRNGASTQPNLGKGPFKVNLNHYLLTLVYFARLPTKR